ncbi:MAG TPA: glycerol-3-phosphate acyltransferase [Terriglobia bacterium]|nr:glycerol-3-phosphate acyltransferase [Terriglobia bacterium]
MPASTLGIIIRFAACFLLGSIPFAVLAMMGTGIDIRNVGSGNPGFNNVLRVNKWRAVVTLIGDMGKGYFAVWLVSHGAPGAALGWLFGFGAILGHCFSPFLKFNGGKGIATSAGVMLRLYPLWAAVAMGFFVVMRLTGSRRKWPEAGATASMSTWVLFTILMLAFVSPRDAFYAALLTLFLGWRHQKNFRNLVAQRELRGRSANSSGPGSSSR